MAATVLPAKCLNRLSSVLIARISVILISMESEFAPAMKKKAGPMPPAGLSAARSMSVNKI